MSRIMKGIQVSFGIGVVVVVAGGLVGTLLGACSGYFGGYVDEVIMKIVDAQMAFPGILLALMLMCIFGRGLSNTIDPPACAKASRAGRLGLSAQFDSMRADGDWLPSAHGQDDHFRRYQKCVFDIFAQAAYAKTTAYRGGGGVARFITSHRPSSMRKAKESIKRALGSIEVEIRATRALEAGALIIPRHDEQVLEIAQLHRVELALHHVA